MRLGSIFCLTVRANGDRKVGLKIVTSQHFEGISPTNISINVWICEDEVPKRTTSACGTNIYSQL